MGVRGWALGAEIPVPVPIPIPVNFGPDWDRDRDWDRDPEVRIPMTEISMLPGRATPEGTAAFAQRMAGKAVAAHFRP